MIQKFKIGAFNVNSISVRSSHVFEILNQHEPDLFFLQELKCQENKFPQEILNHDKYNVFHNCQKAYNGVAIFIKNHLIFNSLKYEIKKDFDFELSHEARYLEIKIEILNKKFLFASVYVPNGSEVGSEKFQFKMLFLQKLRKYLKKMNQEIDLNIIIGGDFNIAPYEIDLFEPFEKQNSIGFSSLERTAIREIFDLGFFDVFRILNPRKQEFSWFDYRNGFFEKNNGMRIDFILCNANMANFIFSSSIESKWRSFSKPSDHLPIFAEFCF